MVAIVTDVRFRMSLALIRDLAQMGVEVITCEGERCRDNPAAPALVFQVLQCAFLIFHVF